MRVEAVKRTQRDGALAMKVEETEQGMKRYEWSRSPIPPWAQPVSRAVSQLVHAVFSSAAPLSASSLDVHPI